MRQPNRQGQTNSPIQSHRKNTDILTGIPFPQPLSQTLNQDSTDLLITANLIQESDGITDNPTIEGTITTDDKIHKFRGGFNDTPEKKYRDLKNTLNKDNSFTLNIDDLNKINKTKTLADGEYTLHFLAEDKAKNLAQSSLTFTLDTIAPLIQAQLSEDTGTKNNDNITANPSITGTIQDANSINSLQGQFNHNSDANFIDVTEAITDNNQFQLNSAILQ